MLQGTSNHFHVRENNIVVSKHFLLFQQHRELLVYMNYKPQTHTRKWYIFSVHVRKRDVAITGYHKNWSVLVLKSQRFKYLDWSANNKNEKGK